MGTLLRNRVYYGLKPLIPLSFRLAMRRWFAARKRRAFQNFWPVFPGSEALPQRWSGWPGGKKFALVLTHDVEGERGYATVLKLMWLERSLGFRSSFNLIPRGSYRVSSQLRKALTDNGFEVGVHDLYHDGKLFLSQKEFNRNAAEINRFLEEWDAVGFRAGFMLHNLAWMHALKIQYDLSTFDTDPFEPQPEGSHTIFPFWVRNPAAAALQEEEAINQREQDEQAPQVLNSNRQAPISALSPGYVELPYTLPQDSTLFLLLVERSPAVWCQKLDWIARHGGMALVNVHPDYMQFDGDPASPRTYPAQFYREFLEYVNVHYGDSCWRPLPKELAAVFRNSLNGNSLCLPAELPKGAQCH